MLALSRSHSSCSYCCIGVNDACTPSAFSICWYTALALIFAPYLVRTVAAQCSEKVLFLHFVHNARCAVIVCHSARALTIACEKLLEVNLFPGTLLLALMHVLTPVQQ
jgi:hypothetical protein